MKVVSLPFFTRFKKHGAPPSFLICIIYSLLKWYFWQLILAAFPTPRLNWVKSHICLHIIIYEDVMILFIIVINFDKFLNSSWAQQRTLLMTWLHRLHILFDCFERLFINCWHSFTLNWLRLLYLCINWPNNAKFISQISEWRFTFHGDVSCLFAVLESLINWWWSFPVVDDLWGCLLDLGHLVKWFVWQYLVTAPGVKLLLVPNVVIVLWWCLVGAIHRHLQVSIDGVGIELVFVSNFCLTSLLTVFTFYVLDVYIIIWFPKILFLTMVGLSQFIFCFGVFHHRYKGCALLISST